MLGINQIYAVADRVPRVYPWVSIASKIGCTPETLRIWIQQSEIDNRQRVGLNSADSDRIKALERENRELWQTNEILRLASAFFAQAELDRPRKK